GVTGDLPASLRHVADDALRGTGLELVYEVRGMRHQLTADVEAVVARILQEAIANTVRHAAARTVRVRLSYRGPGLRLLVADDGRGFLVDRDFRNYGGHWGLLGMEERAGQVGGSLAVRSAPGRGAAVVVHIPYSAAPEEASPPASTFPAG
ncbi:MAG TPA: ATP-binding protein, partial [Gemmatimonadales bacterium]|nr:ATP-binding protein [Gemmatimonadales bacterium]